MLYIIFSSKRDGQDEKQKNDKEVTKEAKSSSDKIEVQLKHQRTLIDEDTLIPRLVANGTKLVHSWEDQYYVVNEYRANAHQVWIIIIQCFYWNRLFSEFDFLNKMIIFCMIIYIFDENRVIQ